MPRNAPKAPWASTHGPTPERVQLLAPDQPKDGAEIIDPLTEAEIVTGANPAWPRNVTAVYFLLQDGKVVYVGKSYSVGCRVAGHLMEGRITFDSWAHCPTDEDALDQVERYYIRKFRPIYNKVHKW